MTKNKIKNIIIVSALCAGLIISGVGAGVLVSEFTNLTYAGTKEIYPEKAVTETVKCNVPIPEKGKKIKVVPSVYTYNYNSREAVSSITADENIPMGVIAYEISYNQAMYRHIDPYFEKENLNNLYIPEVTAYISRNDFVDAGLSTHNYEIESVLNELESIVINGDKGDIENYIFSGNFQNMLNSGINSAIEEEVEDRLEYVISKMEEAQKNNKYIGSVNLSTYYHESFLENFLIIVHQLKEDLSNGEIGDYIPKNNVPKVIKISANPKMIEFLELNFNY